MIQQAESEMHNTHTHASVWVCTTDAVWTVVFSAVKQGPEGLCCLTVHQGSAVTQWHRSPHVTHNAVLTPPHVCVCWGISSCQTADLFMSVVWHRLAPYCNVSSTLITLFYCFKIRVCRNKCINIYLFLYNLEAFMFPGQCVCTNRGKAGVCCGLYCSCLASWGHAFLRVSTVWLQPQHVPSLWPTSSLTTKLYIWVMQLEAFAKSSCSLYSLSSSVN